MRGWDDHNPRQVLPAARSVDDHRRAGQYARINAAYLSYMEKTIRDARDHHAYRIHVRVDQDRRPRGFATARFESMQ
jgi:hypothetical protein